MSAAACLAVLEGAEAFNRAAELDAAFPACACEAWALCQSGGNAVASQELVARILTSPDAYDEDAATIITTKLLAIYSIGLSVVRQGATDLEIEQTVNELLTGGGEPKTLVGAAVILASDIRKFADPSRWFGVYATDSNGKSHHADIFGTVPAGTKSQVRKLKNSRRYEFADELSARVILANNLTDLIRTLRIAGI